MQKFTVALPGPGPKIVPHEGSFEFLDSGILKVTKTDGNSLYYSPTGWLCVDVK